MTRANSFSTHEVANQPPPPFGVNAFRSDPILVDAASGLPKAVRDELAALGQFVATPEAQDLARLANRHPPELKTHDPRGNRIDLVEFHPAYHALMRRSMAAGLHCSVWETGTAAGPARHLARALRFYLMAELECGHLCPLTMTNASIATLMAAPEIRETWAPKILSRQYDSTQKPPMAKTAVTIGMGMTEKQGGTDVRANTSRAMRDGEGNWRLTGHKWFMSAPMSDAFIMLAQTDEGLGCFLVPRILEDGTLNGLRFQRLKDKLGNRSNASSEVEFADVKGYLLGGPGDGIRTILDMVTLTRLDCALASAALMRVSVAEAVFHARHRKVFGDILIDQPLMTRVLADLALDVAAASALALRLAQAFDGARDDPNEAAYARLMTPVVKYWICKIAPSVTYEAMECLGGNGYVEERNLARHYREAPVNAIWEGSGNIMALDVLRVLSRGRTLFDTVLQTFSRDLGGGRARSLDVLSAAMSVCEQDPGYGRMLTEQLALTGAAAELSRIGAGRVADAFIETRLGGAWRTTYGMLDSRFDARQIVEVLYPAAG